MHNYNPDNKYKFQTRIGNWSEEWELEETKKKDYLKGKQNAQLSSIIRDQKTNFSLRVASLSISPDQYLHFGHHLMLKNHKTQYYLAIDIQERMQSDSEAYAITTAPMTQPTVRSVFVIIPYEKEPNYYQDDLLHYGQHFRLLANPRISNNKKFYLHSMPISPVRCAKLSRKQEVCATEADVFNTVWKFEFADPKYRFEYDGQPVQLNETVLIKHSFTQHWLASDDIIYQNDFGREREVFVHSYQCLNKTQNLISEKEGRTTIDIPLRNQEPQNLWSIVVAKDKSQSFDESIIDDTKNVKNLVNQIKQQVLSKGYYGVRGLAKIFDEMDVDRSGLVQYDDFKWGLRNFGIKLSEDESKTIFSTFDQNQTGKIDSSEFLSLFRVQPNALRSNIIKKAYEKVLSQGQVTIETLGKLIQVKQHPDVIKGYKTEKQIFQEFVSNWDKAQPNRIISFDEFNFYYLDISSAIEKDETLEAILKKSWNI